VSVADADLDSVAEVLVEPEAEPEGLAVGAGDCDASDEALPDAEAAGDIVPDGVCTV